MAVTTLRTAASGFPTMEASYRGFSKQMNSTENTKVMMSLDMLVGDPLPNNPSHLARIHIVNVTLLFNAELVGDDGVQKVRKSILEIMDSRRDALNDQYGAMRYAYPAYLPDQEQNHADLS